MSALVVNRVPLTPHPEWPRVTAGPITEVGGLTYGEWTLERAAFTDRHDHVEVNTVLEGELHVTCAGQTHVLGVGDSIAVPAGDVGRYAAPVHARMLFTYGPGLRGMQDAAYEEL